MRIQRPLALLAVAPLFLGACSGSSVTATNLTEPPSTTATTETTAAATPTTSTSVSTTTTQSVEVLLPGNDVDDPTEAIVAIFDYVDYLAANPALANDLLSMVYAETCDCHDRLLADFNTYIANGWAQDDQGIEISTTTITQQFVNGNVLMEVMYSYNPQFVVDASGDRLRLESDEWTDRVSIIGLELGVDDRWRVGVIGIVGDGA